MTSGLLLRSLFVRLYVKNYQKWSLKDNNWPILNSPYFRNYNLNGTRWLWIVRWAYNTFKIKSTTIITIKYIVTYREMSILYILHQMSCFFQTKTYTVTSFTIIVIEFCKCHGLLDKKNLFFISPYLIKIRHF